MKTIVGVASALGRAGVAVVRLSGDKAAKIASVMCEGSGLNFDKQNSHKMQFCKIKTPGFIDSGYVCFFKGPASFTGEDVVEFFCHGGNLIAPKIVEECIRLGAVQSGPGEFTQRAFVNGRMTLDMAEGVIDAINSESERELGAAGKLAGGELGRIIFEIQAKLREVLAGFNVLIDFPSEDGSDEDDVLTGAKETFSEAVKKLEDILKTARTGRMIKSGAVVVLAGLPNAGKSSLLNALASEDVAIVSDIPGTTRDIVKETILYKGIKFNLCDTAGLREAGDLIEKIGVEKARGAMEKADVVLYIIDAAVGAVDEDLANLEKLKSEKLIVVVNKTDLKSIKLKGIEALEVSATTGKGLDELKEKMLEKAGAKEFDESAVILTNARHVQVIEDAAVSLREALSGADEFSLDVLVSMVQAGYNKLGQVTGESGSDAVANEVFARFCVGK